MRRLLLVLAACLPLAQPASAASATADPVKFPLYDVVRNLPGAERLKVLVTHSHSQADHTVGDPQFRGKPGVTLVEPNAGAVREYFKLAQWPEGTATIELGARQLVVIPTPGSRSRTGKRIGRAFAAWWSLREPARFPP